MTSRKQVGKPTARMKDTAWRTLHAIAGDDNAADHARVSAARALVRDERDDEPDIKPSRPPTLVIMPASGRNPELEPLGIRWLPGACWITFDADSPQGLADKDRWIAEAEAKVAADFPPALPAPERKPKLTEAERLRAYRARIKAAKLAALPAPAA